MQKGPLGDVAGVCRGALEGFSLRHRITGAKRWRQVLKASTARLKSPAGNMVTHSANAIAGGWGNNIWSSAPTPSGHANVNFNNGNVNDKPDSNNNYVAAVL